MELSKREFIALELLKEMVKVNIDDVVGMAYLLADEFIDMSDKVSGYEPCTASQVDANVKDNKATDECKRVLLDGVFCRSIDALESSIRSRNCLLHEEIYNIGDLVCKSERELLRTKNIGRKTIREISEILGSVGLKLEMTKDEMAAYKSPDKSCLLHGWR